MTDATLLFSEFMITLDNGFSIRKESHKRPERAKALFYAPIRLTLKHLKSLQCNANKRHRGGGR
ncbi:hypothetical protein ckin22_02200 [Helicobacter pylori]